MRRHGAHVADQEFRIPRRGEHAVRVFEIGEQEVRDARPEATQAARTRECRSQPLPFGVDQLYVYGPGAGPLIVRSIVPLFDTQVEGSVCVSPMTGAGEIVTVAPPLISLPQPVAVLVAMAVYTPA